MQSIFPSVSTINNFQSIYVPVIQILFDLVSSFPEISLDTRRAKMCYSKNIQLVSLVCLWHSSGWIIAWVGQVDLFRKLSDRRILVKIQHFYIIHNPAKWCFFCFFKIHTYNKVQMMSTPQREDWDHRSSQTQAGYLVQLFRNLFYQKEMKARSEALKTLEIKIKYCLFAL